MLRLSLFLSIVTSFVSLVAAVQKCDPSAIIGRGFDVNYYNYTLLDTAFKTDPNFYETGYLSTGYMGSTSGVQMINFWYSIPTKVVIEGDIYGFPTTISNASMSLAGYFLAPQTGVYDFSMVVDDGGFLQFGAGGSCCGNPFEDVTGDYLKAEHRRPRSAKFTLEAGNYYPIKIVWVNWSGPGGLDIKYYAPDGKLVTDIGSQVYKFQDKCVVSNTRTWTGSTTRTVTIPGSTTNSVVVEVPTPTTTVTSYWTGRDKSSTTVTGREGETNTVIIQVPSSTFSSVVTSSTLTFSSESSSSSFFSSSPKPSSSSSLSGGYTNSSIETSTEYSKTSETPTSSAGGHTMTSDDVSYTTETKTIIVTTCNGAGNCGAVTKTYTTTYCPTSTEEQTSFATETRTTVVTTCDEHKCGAVTKTYTTTYCPSATGEESSFVSDTHTTGGSVGPESESSMTTVTLTQTQTESSEITNETIIAEFTETATSFVTITKSESNEGSATSTTVSTVASVVSTFEGGSPVSTFASALLFAPLLALLA